MVSPLSQFKMAKCIISNAQRRKWEKTIRGSAVKELAVEEMQRLQ